MPKQHENNPMSQHQLNGKTVLITGGAKNLGGLISRKFAEQGANLLILNRTGFVGDSIF